MEESEKKFILDFIKVYRSLPPLWDTRHPDYTNRIKKEKAYDKLLQKYREKFPEATKKDLCRKINTLRCNYRRECNKLQLYAEQLGPGEENPYKSSLYYFNALSFVDDDEASVISERTFDETEEPKKKKNKTNDNTTEDSLHHSNEYVKKPIDVCQKAGNRWDSKLFELNKNQPKDVSQKVASVWGSKLNELKRDQRLLAERIINDVLFNGTLGLLNIDTCLKNITPLRNRAHHTAATCSSSTSVACSIPADSSLESSRSNNCEKLSSRPEYTVQLNVSQFRPEELNVKVVDEHLIIEAKHEERDCDGEGYVSRHFVRRFELPTGYDPDLIVSKITSDGILIVNLPAVKGESEELIIPL